MPHSLSRRHSATPGMYIFSMKGFFFCIALASYYCNYSDGLRLKQDKAQDTLVKDRRSVLKVVFPGDNKTSSGQVREMLKEETANFVRRMKRIGALNKIDFTNSAYVRQILSLILGKNRYEKTRPEHLLYKYTVLEEISRLREAQLKTRKTGWYKTGPHNIEATMLPDDLQMDNRDLYDFAVVGSLTTSRLEEFGSQNYNTHEIYCDLLSYGDSADFCPCDVFDWKYENTGAQNGGLCRLKKCWSSSTDCTTLYGSSNCVSSPTRYGRSANGQYGVLYPTKCPSDSDVGKSWMGAGVACRTVSIDAAEQAMTATCEGDNFGWGICFGVTDQPTGGAYWKSCLKYTTRADLKLNLGITDNDYLVKSLEVVDYCPSYLPGALSYVEEGVKHTLPYSAPTSKKQKLKFMKVNGTSFHYAVPSAAASFTGVKKMMSLNIYAQEWCEESEDCWGFLSDSINGAYFLEVNKDSSSTEVDAICGDNSYKGAGQTHLRDSEAGGGLMWQIGTFYSRSGTRRRNAGVPTELKLPAAPGTIFEKVSKPIYGADKYGTNNNCKYEECFRLYQKVGTELKIADGKFTAAYSSVVVDTALFLRAYYKIDKEFGTDIRWNQIVGTQCKKTVNRPDQSHLQYEVVLKRIMINPSNILEGGYRRPYKEQMLGGDSNEELFAYGPSIYTFNRTCHDSYESDPKCNKLGINYYSKRGYGSETYGGSGNRTYCSETYGCFPVKPGAWYHSKLKLRDNAVLLAQQICTAINEGTSFAVKGNGNPLCDGGYNSFFDSFVSGGNGNFHGLVFPKWLGPNAPCRRRLPYNKPHVPTTGCMPQWTAHDGLCNATKPTLSIQSSFRIGVSWGIPSSAYVANSTAQYGYRFSTRFTPGEVFPANPSCYAFTVHSMLSANVDTRGYMNEGYVEFFHSCPKCVTDVGHQCVGVDVDPRNSMLYDGSPPGGTDTVFRASPCVNWTIPSNHFAATQEMTENIIFPPDKKNILACEYTAISHALSTAYQLIKRKRTRTIEMKFRAKEIRRNLRTVGKSTRRLRRARFGGN